MFKVAYLMMGDKCNFRCKYCLQRDNLITLHCEEKVISEKIYDFLLKEAGEMPHGMKFSIMFWGGEPLVYFDTIKAVVERLKDTNLFEFKIISNGALLTKEIVDYMNVNEIYFTLSHDGENTEFTRGQDVLKNLDLRQLFYQIVRAGVLSVVSAKNNSMPRTRDYMEETYGIRNINFDFLLETNDMPEEIYNMDFDVFEDAIKEEMEEVYRLWSGEAKAIRATQHSHFVQRIKLWLDDPTNEVFNFPPCQDMYDVINIDIGGNVYLCHNSTVQLGTIDDTYQQLLAEFTKYNKRANSERCKGCEAFFTCNGGCLLVQSEGEKFERFCRVQKIFARNFINTVLRFQEVPVCTNTNKSV